MISIDQARSLILERVPTAATTEVTLDRAVGAVLAEDVTSDIDSPPYDKSLVDGYAIRAADVRNVGVTLRVIEQVTAGQVPRETVVQGSATTIMTGAALPKGADAVVMVEQTFAERVSGERVSGKQGSGSDDVRIDTADVSVGQNIMRRGASITRGQLVLPSGRVIRAIDVGLLAELGHSVVSVYAEPRVAVLATGNELVAASEHPEAGKIRNSNGPMLLAMARASHASVLDMGICADDIDQMTQAIEHGLSCDVLLLSGGVSAGVLDLVPRVLEQIGVRQVFHKVRLKPGKPMWFGVASGGDRPTLVFGLPGNPVGCLVCFELFVAPVLRRMRGFEAVGTQICDANLTGPHQHQSDRPTYHPGQASFVETGQLVVSPLSWQGSADQTAIVSANCLVLFPSGRRSFSAGETVQILSLERWAPSTQPSQAMFDPCDLGPSPR